jgi:acetyl esterase/lipase
VSDNLDVVYSKRHDRDLHLDIYQPPGPGNHRTAVLLFHGGGFRQGDRKMLAPRCAALAQRGFTAIAVQYRLIDDTDTAWPDPLYDIKEAISWTAAHADEIGVDAGKLVLQGHSAGAQLALMAAGTVGKPEFDPPFELDAPEAQVAALIAYYPLVKFAVRDMPALPSDGPPTPEMLADMIKAARGDDGSTPASMLLGPAATEEQAAQASPINHVSGGLPPILIFQGTADMVVAPTASFRLFDALQAAGVVSELHIMADCLHELDATPSLLEPCVAATESFLRRLVIDPSGFAEEETTHNPLAALGRPQK